MPCLDGHCPISSTICASHHPSPTPRDSFWNPFWNPPSCPSSEGVVVLTLIKLGHLLLLGGRDLLVLPATGQDVPVYPQGCTNLSQQTVPTQGVQNSYFGSTRPKSKYRNRKIHFGLCCLGFFLLCVSILCQANKPLNNIIPAEK